MNRPDAKQIDSRIRKLVDARAIADGIVSQVQDKLPRGAGNKPNSSQDTKDCVNRMRAITYKELMAAGTFYKLVCDIKTIADSALSRLCGNCGEQAAIAFMMLVEKKVEPIDYMWCAGEDDDHAFVVIGRRENSQVRRYDAGTWGPDAVVCDPWMGKAYDCSDMKTNLAELQPGSKPPRAYTLTFEYASACRYRTVEGQTPL